MITGGTGSFGKNALGLCWRNISRRRVIIYSRDELKQFEMSRTFTSSAMRFFLGDVHDLPRLNTAMARLTMSSMPAALKQVPAAEYNPMDCVKTNIFGAENVIDAPMQMA